MMTMMILMMMMMTIMRITIPRWWTARGGSNIGRIDPLPPQMLKQWKLFQTFSSSFILWYFLIFLHIALPSNAQWKHLEETCFTSQHEYMLDMESQQIFQIAGCPFQQGLSSPPTVLAQKISAERCNFILPRNYLSHWENHSLVMSLFKKQSKAKKK